MVKKILKNKLNSQKGITAANAVLAMVIILTSVGIISMVYVNLYMNSSEIDKKAGATRIATNITENMNEVYYTEVQDELETLYTSGVAIKEGNTYTIPASNGAKVFKTSIPKGYTCEITLDNINDQNIITKVSVKVNYIVNNLQKGVELTQVLEKEVVRECNSPRFSEQYIRQMVDTSIDYVMVSDTASDIQNGVKIICPIKYDKKNDSYVIVSDVLNNPIWYSYSNKDWAKVLVLEVSDYQKYVDYENGIVESTFFENTSNLKNLYLWVPRFGVQNGSSIFGGTYFKYKKTNLPIQNSYNSSEDEICNYYIDSTNNFGWSTSYELSFDNDINNSGVWLPYSDLTTVYNDAYYLNKSGYGPMITNW